MLFDPVKQAQLEAYKNKLLDEAEALIDSQVDLLIEKNPALGTAVPRHIVKLGLLYLQAVVPEIPESTQKLFEELIARTVSRNLVTEADFSTMQEMLDQHFPPPKLS